jgi:hypothetical protein
MINITGLERKALTLMAEIKIPMLLYALYGHVYFVNTISVMVGSYDGSV